MVREPFETWLVDNFAGLLLVSGQSVLVGIGHLANAIDAAQRQGFAIIGIEGFRTDGTGIQPLPDYIADLSGAETEPAQYVGRTYDIAREIAAEWTHGPEFVELVVVPAA